MEDYEALLKRAKEKLPKSISKGERFSIPPVNVFLEGKTTVFRNFGQERGSCLSSERTWHRWDV
jgi:translation initiation factor 2 beta subunit (eIF-2beta)/eIF-5